jgi:hypothetical protein
MKLDFGYRKDCSSSQQKRSGGNSSGNSSHEVLAQQQGRWAEWYDLKQGRSIWKYDGEPRTGAHQPVWRRGCSFECGQYVNLAGLGVDKEQEMDADAEAEAEAEAEEALPRENTALLLALHHHEPQLALLLLRRNEAVTCHVGDRIGMTYPYLLPFKHGRRHGHGGRGEGGAVHGDGGAGAGSGAVEEGSMNNDDVYDDDEFWGEEEGTFDDDFERYDRYPDLCNIDALTHSRGSAGITALRLSLVSGYVSVATRLLEIGADPFKMAHRRDTDGRVCMHDLARMPVGELVIHHEHAMASSSGSAVAGASAAAVQIQEGDDERYLLREYAMQLLDSSTGVHPQRGQRCMDFSGNFPLHYACAHGNGWLVELLVKKESSTTTAQSSIVGRNKLNQPNMLGWTPLALAVYHGQLSIVKTLLDANVRPLQSLTLESGPSGRFHCTQNIALHFQREWGLAWLIKPLIFYVEAFLAIMYPENENGSKIPPPLSSVLEWPITNPADEDNFKKQIKDAGDHQGKGDIFCLRFSDVCHNLRGMVTGKSMGLRAGGGVLAGCENDLELAIELLKLKGVCYKLFQKGDQKVEIGPYKKQSLYDTLEDASEKQQMMGSGAWVLFCGARGWWMLMKALYKGHLDCERIVMYRPPKRIWENAQVSETHSETTVPPKRGVFRAASYALLKKRAASMDRIDRMDRTSDNEKHDGETGADDGASKSQVVPDNSDKALHMKGDIIWVRKNRIPGKGSAPDDKYALACVTKAPKKHKISYTVTLELWRPVSSKGTISFYFDKAVRMTNMETGQKAVQQMVKVEAGDTKALNKSEWRDKLAVVRKRGKKPRPTKFVAWLGRSHDNKLQRRKERTGLAKEYQPLFSSSCSSDEIGSKDTLAQAIERGERLCFALALPELAFYRQIYLQLSCFAVRVRFARDAKQCLGRLLHRQHAARLQSSLPMCVLKRSTCQGIVAHIPGSLPAISVSQNVLAAAVASANNQEGAEGNVGQKARVNTEKEVRLVLDAFNIGLLRLRQAKEERRRVRHFHKYSHQVREATKQVDVAKSIHNCMYERSNEAKIRRLHFLVRQLMYPFTSGESMSRFLCYVLLLTMLAFYTSVANIGATPWSIGPEPFLNKEWISDFDPIPHSVEPFEIAFGNIIKLGEFQEFAIGPMADKLFPDEADAAPGYLDDYNRLLGPVRIRQVRSTPISCLAASSSTAGITRETFVEPADQCYDTGSFDRSPLSKVAADGTNEVKTWNWVDRKGWGWPDMYKSEMTSSDLLIRYSTGGYVVDLTELKGGSGSSRAQLEQLVKENWFDVHTRAVFVEWSTYNANLDRVLVAELRVEFPETAGAVVYSHFNSVPAYMLSGWDEAWSSAVGVLRAVQVFLLLCSTYILVSELKQMIEKVTEALDALKQEEEQEEAEQQAEEEKRRMKMGALERVAKIGATVKLQRVLIGLGDYAADVWNPADLIAVVMVFTWQFFQFKAFLAAEQLEYTPGTTTYVDVKYVVEDLERAQDFITIGLIVNWLKLLKFFRLIPFLGPMIQASVLSLCNSTVFFYLVFYIYFTFSVCVGLMVGFGGNLSSFRSFLPSFISSFEQMLGNSNLEGMQGHRFDLGTVLFFFMAICGGLVLTNLFIGVVSNVYQGELRSSLENWEAEVNEKMADELVVKSYRSSSWSYRSVWRAIRRLRKKLLCRKKNEQEIENDKRKQALEHAQDAWRYYFGLMRQKKSRQKKSPKYHKFNRLQEDSGQTEETGPVRWDRIDGRLSDDEQSRAHRVLAKHFIHEFLFEPSATIAPLYEAVRETKDLSVDLFRFDVPKTETDTYHAHCGPDQDKRRARRCLSMGMCGCSSKRDGDGGSGGSGSEGGQRSRITRRLPPAAHLVPHLRELPSAPGEGGEDGVAPAATITQTNTTAPALAPSTQVQVQMQMMKQQHEQQQESLKWQEALIKRQQQQIQQQRRGDDVNTSASADAAQKGMWTLTKAKGSAGADANAIKQQEQPPQPPQAQIPVRGRGPVSGPLAVGVAVVIQGLHNSPRLNGSLATVVRRLNMTIESYEVRAIVQGPAKQILLKLKRQNLREVKDKHEDLLD